MTLSDATAYFMTITAIALAPGPVVLMLLVRAAGNDVGGAVFFGTGYAIGGVLITTAVCFGLGPWLQAVPDVFLYGRWLMMAYILWLAWGIWNSGFSLRDTVCGSVSGHMRAGFAGLTTCFLSPYMILLFPLVLPGAVDIATVRGAAFLFVAVLTFVGLALGAGLVIVFAAQVRRMIASPSSLLLLNRGLACTLVSAGSWLTLS